MSGFRQDANIEIRPIAVLTKDRLWLLIMRPLAFIVCILFAAFASKAHALCSYNGVDNAKTTIGQEFRDSRWVVRAKVLSATDHFSDAGESWTIYQLEVQHAYKGRPGTSLRFFTYRDSGGFYMDRPWVNLPEGHDIGGEYLLFLNPRQAHPSQPDAANGAVFVNYSCGASERWSGVSAASLSELQALER